MTRFEIEQEIDFLYRDLEAVMSADEADVRRMFGVSSKHERLKEITEQIDRYEEKLREYVTPEI